MAVSTVKSTMPFAIQKVWNLVTNLEKHTWRSDLSWIEILSEHQFVEYTKDGFATTFTITAMEFCRCWEFDMENENMIGHWTGRFTQEGDGTTVTFTEDVTAKKTILRPFLPIYLKKQQTLYLADLKKALLG